MSVAPFRMAALMQSSMLRSPFNPIAGSDISRTAAAASELFESVTRRYRKPEWKLPTTTINGVDVAVTPRSVWSTPWCRMLHFERDAKALSNARGERTDPTVLIVAPMSGHYATLLRGTVRALLPEHDVYITDWRDARMVPLALGEFEGGRSVSGGDDAVAIGFGDAAQERERLGLVVDGEDAQGRAVGAAQFGEIGAHEYILRNHLWGFYGTRYASAVRCAARRFLITCPSIAQNSAP